MTNSPKKPAARRAAASSGPSSAKSSSSTASDAGSKRRANPMQDIQDAFTKPMKDAAERMQKLDMGAITRSMQSVNLQDAASTLLDSGRKDLKALVEANEKSFRGLQAVVQRQGELLQASIGEWQNAMQGLPGKSPKEKLAQLDDLARASFQRAVGDMKELAELAARSQADAFDVVRARIDDNVQQVSKLLQRDRDPKP